MPPSLRPRTLCCKVNPAGVAIERGRRGKSPTAADTIIMNPPLDLPAWLGRFRRNKAGRPGPSWHLPLNVPPAAMPALIRSIREFQLGDGGGPASLIAWNAARFRDQSAA